MFVLSNVVIGHYGGPSTDLGNRGTRAFISGEQAGTKVKQNEGNKGNLGEQQT